MSIFSVKYVAYFELHSTFTADSNPLGNKYTRMVDGHLHAMIVDSSQQHKTRFYMFFLIMKTHMRKCLLPESKAIFMQSPLIKWTTQKEELKSLFYGSFIQTTTSYVVYAWPLLVCEKVVNKCRLSCLHTNSRVQSFTASLLLDEI